MYHCLPVALVNGSAAGGAGRAAGPDTAGRNRFCRQARRADRGGRPGGNPQGASNGYYGQEESESFSEILKELDANKKIAREVVEAGDDAKAAEALANEVPIVKFVNLVLQQAVQDRASDIHFEPFETDFRIRYRVDGALYEMAPPPKHLALPVISRIKVMANLNISERRLPQDGRITMIVAGKQIDLRVSCCPRPFGESIVLRVLDRSLGEPGSRSRSACPNTSMISSPR